MTTMKSYTDLEQSKKLVEILPIESADMFYWCADHYPKEDWIIEVGPLDDDYECICAWSLAALLNIIPKKIKDFNVLRIDIGESTFAIWYDEIGYGVNRELPDIEMKEPVDACVEMILKLKEKNQI